MKDNIFYIIKNGFGSFDVNLRGAYVGFLPAERAEKIQKVSEVDSIHFIVKGRGSLQIAGKSLYMLKSGMAFYLPKDVKISCWPAGEEPYEYYSIAVEAFDRRKFFDQIGFSKLHPVAYFDERVIDCVRELYETARQGTMAGGYKGISLLYNIFALLAEHGEEQKETDSENEYVAQALAFISAKYYDDINVNKLAGVLNINRSYFSTLFKKIMGVSPLTYLTKFRIMQACKLLAMDKNITEVAILTGFNTPTNFSVHFKRIMNVTPLEYKKQLRNKGEKL